MLSLNFILNSCAGGKSAAQTATPEIPTSTPAPLRNLTICLGYEPSSLYLYGTNSQAAWSVLEAIYDGPIDTRNYLSVPVILEKMPAFDDGDAAFQPLGVQAGDEILDADGNLVTLTEGVELYPRGCTSPDCILTWDGTSQLQMDQLVVTYKLLPDLKWSDGVPLTAADSVYSFQLASDPATPVVKYTGDQVASYQALDALTVQMVSKPGLVTDAFDKYFWTPLPQHVWGEYTAEELLTAEVSTRTPLGWGAYVIEEWIPGEAIHLKSNPYYFRADEGLPKFDFLEFKVIGTQGDSNINALGDGLCDFLDYSILFYDQIYNINNLLNLYQKPYITAYFTPGPDLEFILFNVNAYIKKMNKNDKYKLNFLSDLSLRRAVVDCLNREKALQKVFYNLIEIPPTYLPPSHPFYQAELEQYAYSPEEGTQILEGLGWIDHDNDPTTPRISSGVKDIEDGTQLILDYITTQDNVHPLFSQILAESLEECGIGINLEVCHREILLSPTPKNPIFSREFDIAQYTWSTGNTSPCYLFLSPESADKVYPEFAEDLNLLNFSGYGNPLFDSLCLQALKAKTSDEKTQAIHNQMQELLNQDLPYFPLYYHPTIALARPDFCNFKLDISARSDLWNIEELDYGVTCGRLPTE
jgi:peptide/nickel transport system substrate-binding protein